MSNEHTADEAALWWAHRRRTVRDAAEERRFAEWRDADPAHAAAYDRLERVWQAAGNAGEEPEIMALRRAAERRLAQPVRRRAYGIYGGIAAALLALAAGAAMLHDGVLQSAPQAAPVVADAGTMTAEAPAMAPQAMAEARVYQTGAGEQSTIRLADGSTVTLAARTRLAVHLEQKRRSIDLLAGQALFEVAPDKTRPFVVRAGDRQITALGTAFDVRLDGRELRVTLVEGRIAVEKQASSAIAQLFADDPTILAPSQQLRARDDAEQLLAVSTERVTSWRAGRLIFDDDPLPQVIAEVNRYAPTPIALAEDPRLRELRVSGIFRLDRTASFAAALAAYLPVEAQAEPGRMLLSWRDPEAEKKL